MKETNNVDHSNICPYWHENVEALCTIIKSKPEFLGKEKFKEVLEESIENLRDKCFYCTVTVESNLRNVDDAINMFYTVHS